MYPDNLSMDWHGSNPLITPFQCGKIREVVIHRVDSKNTVATVEFMDKVTNFLRYQSDYRLTTNFLHSVSWFSGKSPASPNKGQKASFECRGDRDVGVALDSICYQFSWSGQRWLGQVSVRRSEPDSFFMTGSVRIDELLLLNSSEQSLMCAGPVNDSRVLEDFAMCNLLLRCVSETNFVLISDRHLVFKSHALTMSLCTHQDSAQSALALHNTEVAPQQRMSVFISDPLRKKSRTDTGANDRELYITCLTKFVQESDLRKMFEPVSLPCSWYADKISWSPSYLQFGEIKGVRMMLNEQGHSKGFAFVEFETEVRISLLSMRHHTGSCPWVYGPNVLVISEGCTHLEQRWTEETEDRCDDIGC